MCYFSFLFFSCRSPTLLRNSSQLTPQVFPSAWSWWDMVSSIPRQPRGSFSLFQLHAHPEAGCGLDSAPGHAAQMLFCEATDPRAELFQHLSRLAFPSVRGWPVFLKLLLLSASEPPVSSHFVKESLVSLVPPREKSFEVYFGVSESREMRWWWGG